MSISICRHWQNGSFQNGFSLGYPLNQALSDSSLENMQSENWKICKVDCGKCVK